jgi:hypothetical protein
MPLFGAIALVAARFAQIGGEQRIHVLTFE